MEVDLPRTKLLREEECRPPQTGNSGLHHQRSFCCMHLRCRGLLCFQVSNGHLFKTQTQGLQHSQTLEFWGMQLWFHKRRSFAKRVVVEDPQCRFNLCFQLVLNLFCFEVFADKKLKDFSRAFYGTLNHDGTTIQLCQDAFVSRHSLQKLGSNLGLVNTVVWVG